MTESVNEKIYRDEQVIADIWFCPEHNKSEDPHFIYYHREGGEPARTFYTIFGDLAEEAWFIDNELHRDEAPAKILYDTDGTRLEEIWAHNGKVYRHKIMGKYVQ